VNAYFCPTEARRAGGTGPGRRQGQRQRWEIQGWETPARTEGHLAGEEREETRVSEDAHLLDTRLHELCCPPDELVFCV